MRIITFWVMLCLLFTSVIAGEPKKEYGIASWYGKPHHGRKTASGETYNMYAYTAAHKFLPFGTLVVVRNLKNGETVTVKINDRGPFIKGRIIDLSKAAADSIRMSGVAQVEIEI